MKRGLVLLALAAVGAIMVLRAITALMDTDAVAERPRPAAFRFCPPVTLQAADLPLTDTTLRNLGGNVMGRSATYGDAERQVQIHVGFNALEALEDLDMSPLPGSGPAVALLEGRALAGITPLLAATWTDPGRRAPCGSVTMISSGLSPVEFERLWAPASADARSADRTSSR